MRFHPPGLLSYLPAVKMFIMLVYSSGFPTHKNWRGPCNSLIQFQQEEETLLKQDCKFDLQTG